MFFAGLALGVVIGGCGGMVIAALMAAARREDESRRLDKDEVVRELRATGQRLVYAEDAECPDVIADTVVELVKTVIRMEGSRL